MRKRLVCSIIFMGWILPLLSQPHRAELAEGKEIRVEEGIEHSEAGSGTLWLADFEGGIHLRTLLNSSLVVAANRFIDNGDGTITDTQRKIMWQKSDNGKQVTFEEAQEYCKSLRLGNHADWRLPKPEEGDTAVAVELMMPRHSTAPEVHFDLYWSSDPSVLIPFNYRPSYGAEVLGAYPANKGGRAFVRAVRRLGPA
jgi:Protein of unknown function (DUF1566)